MGLGFVTFAVAFAATLSATQFVRVTALRLRAIDRPGGRRVHQRPTARLGGLGIFWGFAGALLLVIYGRPAWKQVLAGGESELLGLLAAGGVLLMVGLRDDTRGLRALVKLAAQVAAAIVLWGAGWRVTALALPGVGAWPVGNLSLALTIAWVALVTNAFNLIDGLDGLACGTALAACAGLALVLGPGEGFARVAVTALGGALLGFLWFNFNPALIFMGDSGSLFVGLVLAATTLRAGGAAGGAFPLVPLLLIAVPVADTVAAVVRRTLGALRERGTGGGIVGAACARVFAPDRGHVHHVLMRSGRSTRRSVGILWAAAVSFAAAAWLCTVSLGVGLAVAAVLALAWGAGFERVRRHLHANPPAVLHSSQAGPAAEPFDAAA